jgi:hypothetical protein
LEEERKGKKKKRERNIQRHFAEGWRPDMPCWLCRAGFSWLLGVIKG